MFRGGRYFEPLTRLSMREFQIILIVFILFMSVSMLFVWSNIKTLRQAYKYQVLKKENRNLTKVNGFLILERESLQSLHRIQDIAEKEIGMVAPGPGQMITVFLK